MNRHTRPQVLMGIALLWIVGMLCPFESLGRYSRDYHAVFAYVFRAEWVHVAAHAALFAGLAYLLARLLPATRYRYPVILVVIVGVAVGQESIQLWTRHRSLGAPERFDFVVDLCGAAIGSGAARLWEIWRKKIA